MIVFPSREDEFINNSYIYLRGKFQPLWLKRPTLKGPIFLALGALPAIKATVSVVMTWLTLGKNSMKESIAIDAYKEDSRGAQV